MDHLLYIAMSGAKENMNSLAVRGNNLANANTIGFKSDFEQARSMQAFGEGLPTRVFAMTERPGQNLQHGMLMTTGRDLDVAVDGPGWIAVQDPNGAEAYTRMGNLQLNATGNLQTSTGLNVVDDAGQPIVLPLPMEKIEINRDGTISGRPEGAPPTCRRISSASSWSIRRAMRWRRARMACFVARMARRRPRLPTWA